MGRQDSNEKFFNIDKVSDLLLNVSFIFSKQFQNKTFCTLESNFSIKVYFGCECKTKTNSINQLYINWEEVSEMKISLQVAISWHSNWHPPGTSENRNMIKSVEIEVSFDSLVSAKTFFEQAWKL